MKNKILLAGGLIIVFIFATNVYAVDRNDNAGVSNQVQEQTQTANQGENSQVQTQNIQVQSETGERVQSQNQIKNKGEEIQVQNQKQQTKQTVEQRRSQVANATQEILNVAERNGGIGQQVRVIAQAQNQNQEKLETNLAKVKNRSGFMKFFIGANYGEINNAKKTLEQNRQQIQQLNEIKNQLTNQSEQQNLSQQIQVFEQVNSQMENLIDDSQKGFSLFGWMFKWFIFRTN